MAGTGLFITLEGGEGAGKSTQARLLAEALRVEGHNVLLTREPGGTPGAEEIRNLLLFGKVDLSWRAEILMHMAARSDHLDNAILPALERGEIVVCDRFHDSTLAYQGYGVGQGSPEVLAFLNGARKLVNFEPDLTLMLELPRAQALERLNARGGQTDRYEGQAEAFHERVLAGFDAIASADPLRVKRVDAGQTPEAVSAALLQAVQNRLMVQGV
ncbi:dTMP kinase [Gluconobacter kondonii]|uniref:Thymidylate kinase n=1 Tax=Gluconobacter kondonii TaxID=941463 RepID=A0ABQ5WQC3_9PROT|nr:dTMP kinase [Gluconobacter kondonii]MBN3866550.1 dTMP kinase [Gluconobacter kondonii]MBS1052852.1 dTMP kinase [Gluconobacter kondonii]MBS1056565.1 dTMP kinase [Gluconobacter kondonii]MBS1076731.1 dTMP kinase [Gluconobacter kondonii]MCP1235911.1 dTMP kinase [Gluconobacter kondonii]